MTDPVSEFKNNLKEPVTGKTFNLISSLNYLKYNINLRITTPFTTNVTMTFSAKEVKYKLTKYLPFKLLPLAFVRLKRDLQSPNPNHI